MGWEIHITRADFWPDSDECPIESSEWLELVAADAELMIDPRDNGPHFALRTAHFVEGDHPWFDLFQGHIDAKHPDRRTLGKAIEIARRLDAKVQGDDGEEYSRPEDLAV